MEAESQAPKSKRFPSSVDMPTVAIVVFVALLTLLAFALIFSRAMARDLNHDEHYFVASGKLLADHALLPYRDYPYSHMPNLVFIYALLFKLSDYILFSARAFSVICATLLVLCLFVFTYRLLPQQRTGIRLAVACGVVFFLLANPLFTYTSGLAWSHDFPVLLILLAFACHLRGAGKKRANLWNFISGLCLGLAIGTRLTFVTALIPFGVALVFYPQVPSKKARLQLLFSFGLGVLAGVLPAIILFVVTPRNFIFWNTLFIRINTFYRQSAGEGRIGLVAKLDYFLKDVCGDPGNLLLLLAFLFFALSTELAAVIRQRKFQLGSSLVLLLVIFLALGAFVPSPSYYQYFYAPVPFAVLGVAYGFARLVEAAKDQGPRWFLALLAQMILLTNLYALGDYAHLPILAHRSSWSPIFVHAVGIQLESAVEQGKVLTLSPIYPLEGGLEIYPELATGPFVWRTAHLIPEEQRREFGALSYLDLDDFLAQDAPGAIFITAKTELEEPLIDYALRYGYRRVDGLPLDHWLWVR